MIKQGLNLSPKRYLLFNTSNGFERSAIGDWLAKHNKEPADLCEFTKLKSAAMLNIVQSGKKGNGLFTGHRHIFRARI